MLIHMMSYKFAFVLYYMKVNLFHPTINSGAVCTLGCSFAQSFGKGAAGNSDSDTELWQVKATVNMSLIVLRFNLKYHTSEMEVFST